MKKRKIRWDAQPSAAFREAIAYIRKQSPQNAEKVKAEWLEKIKALSDRPEVHSPDKYKLLNPGNNQRAFELHHYRISYLVKEDEIVISRMRHTSQEPQDF